MIFYEISVFVYLQALGNLYFIHEDIDNVLIWDFVGKCPHPCMCVHTHVCVSARVYMLCEYLLPASVLFLFFSVCLCVYV